MFQFSFPQVSKDPPQVAIHYNVNHVCKVVLVLIFEAKSSRMNILCEIPDTSSRLNVTILHTDTPTHCVLLFLDCSQSAETDPADHARGKIKLRKGSLK